MKPTTTPAQVAANRANSAASTGPKTAEGKEASKYNRLTHGLSSPLTVLPFESQAEYNHLYESFCEEYSPATPTEQSFLRQMVDAQWKLRRLENLEQQVFLAMSGDSRSQPNADPFAAMAASLLGPGKHQQALNSLARYQATLNRQFVTAFKSLRACQAERQEADRERTKRETIHQIVGIADRSQSERSVLDILAADPYAVTRYIEAETTVLATRASRQVSRPRAPETEAAA